LNQHHLISKRDFTLNATFYLRFLSFKQRVEISFFYNRTGQLDFEFFPTERLLILYSRNFRAHKAARTFLLSAVNNIAYQLTVGFMREASQSGSLMKSFPSLFVFSALQQMIESSKSIIRYNYQLSTLTNRVYSVQFKYLLGNGLRIGDQDIRIVASLHPGRIIHIMKLLQSEVGIKNQNTKAELKSLISFYSDFKRRTESKTRIWSENPIREIISKGKQAKSNTKLLEAVRDNFSSDNLKNLLRSKKVESAKNFDWLNDIKINGGKAVNKFISQNFHQLNSAESLDDYAIPQNRLWSQIRKDQTR